MFLNVTSSINVKFNALIGYVTLHIPKLMYERMDKMIYILLLNNKKITMAIHNKPIP
jgi:hypothetical protein